MTEPLLAVEGLRVRFGPDAPPAVDGIDLKLAPGECLALVGESGSGKSVTVRSLLGLAGPGARVEGEITLGGRRVERLGERAWRSLRGSTAGFVLQDALVSLDPLRPVGREIEDALRLHTRLGPRARAERVRTLLADVELPRPEVQARRRAGQLSGGMRQRALVASAIALDPPLLLADEPTTALDATVQARLLELLGGLVARGTALLLVSHDLAVVEDVADRVAVLHGGRIVEQGPTRSVLRSPREPYTRALVNAIPAARPRGARLSAGSRPTPPAGNHRPVASAAQRPEAALELRGIDKTFPGRDGVTVAAEGVHLAVRPGRTLGLVGESGSGKTTLARIALGLERPDAGEVLLGGRRFSPLPERQRASMRPALGAIHQDAYSSFAPGRRVRNILADALTGGRPRHAEPDEIAALLETVGLDAALGSRTPDRLSGGQRQRVAIARALAAGPDVLLCDEPVSSLDVLVQARILDLLDELQETRGLAYLLISHDMAVIEHMSDTIAVMEAGRIVEQGPAARVLGEPRHPYTRTLLGSVVGRRP